MKIIEKILVVIAFFLPSLGDNPQTDVHPGTCPNQCCTGTKLQAPCHSWSKGDSHCLLARINCLGTQDSGSNILSVPLPSPPPPPPPFLVKSPCFRLFQVLKIQSFPSAYSGLTIWSWKTFHKCWVYYFFVG